MRDASRVFPGSLPALLDASVHADVFVPNGRVGGDVGGEEGDAFGGVEVDDLDAELAEPVDAAAEVLALADDETAEAELADEAGAVPAGGEGGDHGDGAVAALAAGAAEGVGLGMGAGVAILHAAVVAGGDEAAVGVVERGTDGKAALVEAEAGFVKGGNEHRFGLGAQGGVKRYIGDQGSRVPWLISSMTSSRREGFWGPGALGALP